MRHAADELAAFATLLERPPLDDVEIEEKLAVRITKSIRTILSALSTEAGSGRHPCPDILREDHNEAVDWITANCMATRRDNGNMDYSLGAMIAAYEAGIMQVRAVEDLRRIKAMSDQTNEVTHG